jgi:hypothetical protein
MRHSRCIAAALAAAAVLVAASCATTDKTMRAVSEPQVRAEAEGVALTLRFRDEQDLAKRFGTTANPFLTEYYRLIFRRIIVFELRIENGAADPYALRLSDCELHFADKVTTPTNAFQLLNYWEATDDRRQITLQREPLIKRYVLPNQVTVKPGGSVSGFIVFMGNLPNHGEARVLLPGPGTNGSPIEFTFQF